MGFNSEFKGLIC